MADLLGRFKAFRERRKERLILTRAGRGLERERRLKLREISMQEASQREITKQKRIAEVREAQLRRAKAEAGIQRAKARQFQAARQVTQARKVPRSAIFFAPTRPMPKKKQPARDILGKFRVL